MSTAIDDRVGAAHSIVPADVRAALAVERRKAAEALFASRPHLGKLGALEQFKKDGTGQCMDCTLLSQFPLFQGKAPSDHPYPQAFTEGATDDH